MTTILSEDELEQVVGGQSSPLPTGPQPSMPVGQLDCRCTYGSGEICPYNAFPGSDFCRGCPNNG